MCHCWDLTRFFTYGHLEFYTVLCRPRIYMDAALNQLRVEGLEVKPEDVARLSPLIHKHINFQGRYSFALSESVAQGGLRPLRDPYEQDA